MKILKFFQKTTAILLIAAFTLTPVAAFASTYVVWGPSGQQSNGYFTSHPLMKVQLDCTNGKHSDPTLDFTSTYVPLSEGAHYVKVMATSDGDLGIFKDNNYMPEDGSCGNSLNPMSVVLWQGTVKWDFSPPSISITSPQNNFNTTEGTIIVSGPASDAGSDIQSVLVNGIQASLGSSSYSVKVPLNVGLNTISAVATDGSGKTSNSNSITVLRIQDNSKGKTNTSNNSQQGAGPNENSQHNTTSSSGNKFSIKNGQLTNNLKIRMRYKPALYLLSFIYHIPEKNIEQVITFSGSFPYMVRN